MPIVAVSESLPFSAAQWARLQGSLGPEIIWIPDDSPTALTSALRRAEIAILAEAVDLSGFDTPHLRWVHCNHAGLEVMAKPAVFERNLVLTSAAGRSGEALAEHVMMFALMLSARYQSFFKAQDKGDWLITPPASARALKGQTMGIVGLGHTGRALAARASAFGMRVFGYRRSQREVPAGVDRVYTSETGDNIDMMLCQSDILVLAVPLSNATRRLIGAPELALLPKGAMLINISRGDILDQDALLAGLESGHIGGAGLDVTSPEPLPREHRLWGMPNVFITPHMTAPLADKSQRSLEIILDNVRLFRSGLPLSNQITPKDIYC